MSAIKIKPLIVFALLVQFFSFAQTSIAAEKEVHVGILAVWGKKVTNKMWQPTIDYLNKTLPNYHFILTPLNLSETTQKVKLREIDFILTNPGNYVSLEHHFGISRLATLKRKKQNGASNQFSSVIFTKKNRDDIQTLKDLRKKSFIGVSKNAFGGFQMAWLEFKNNGINPFTDFSSLQFSGLPQDKIVYAVLSGKIDAGTVRSSTLERMSQENLININDFKIINRKSQEHFPFIHSTSLYPEWPFAKLKHTSEKIAKELSVALFQLPADSIAAKQSLSSGWTVPLDYVPVKNLFKELNLEPYNTHSPNIFDKYWGIILLIILFIFPAILFYIYQLKNILRIDKDILSKSETEWETALDFLDEPMYMVDLEDKIIRANKAFYQQIKSTPNDAIGKVVTNFTHPEGEEVPCKVCQARKKRIDTTVILEADDPINKASVPLEISVKVIRDEENNAIGIVQRMRDLTEEQEQEKTFRRNERLFTELLDATPDPLIISNSDGTIVLVNTQFEKQIGYKRDEIVGFKIERLIPAKLQKAHINHRQNFSKGPQYRPMSQVQNLVIVNKALKSIPVEISLTPFTIDDDKLIITTIHDITKTIEREKELERLATFPELNPNPIIEFNTKKDITYANEAATNQFPDLFKPGHILFEDIDVDIESHTNHEILRDIDVNGSTFEQKIIFNPETKHYRSYIWDITKIRTLTQKMTFQATHDSLTNLINRRELERRLSDSISNAKTNNVTHSICYMDLDKFKTVNDSCGHVAGDELLKQISNIINKMVRASDTFARLGGDEFALLFENCPIDKAAALAEDIRLAVEKYRFHWNEKIFKIGISIGVVAIDNDSGTLKKIQYAADTACYMAKEQGRNRVHIFESGSKEITEHKNKTNWLNRINSALDNNQFILYFQKIASIENINDMHYEVLVRMISSDGKTVPPSAFIPAAERFNIMSSIDDWVIKNTLPIMRQDKYININFSVNLSGQSLSDEKFMNNCIKQISDANIDATRLCFEITETAMIENINSAIHSVSTLRGFGCKVALDDFGSGLSSFAYLKKLPVDYLKIDGSLVKDIENDPISVTMVSSINHIGHSMGLQTIAEYVENDAILSILSELKVDYVQGYGIAKPVPLDEIML